MKSTLYFIGVWNFPSIISCFRSGSTPSSPYCTEVCISLTHLPSNFFLNRINYHRSLCAF